MQRPKQGSWLEMASRQVHGLRIPCAGLRGVGYLFGAGATAVAVDVPDPNISRQVRGFKKRVRHLFGIRLGDRDGDEI